jgi:hypothetical protein
MTYASPSNGFNEILAASSPKVRDLATRALELIRNVMPNVVEVPWPTQGIAGYGVGPKKMSEHFCYISTHKDHIDLGFNYGSELPDPEGLLEGTGKLFRHIKINTPEDLDRPAVRLLLEAASKHRMPSKPAGA